MKKLYSSLFICLIVLTAVAKDRTPAQMRDVAVQKLSTTSGQKAYTRTASSVKQIINKPMLCVFSDDENFVIVSRDDRFPAMLAYGSGRFSTDNMPDGLAWWMEAVQRAMTNMNGMTRSESHTPVTPLVTTKWGQGTPFNNYAPSLKLYDGRKAPAGCVAIAMAQIMNYQKYPASAQFEGHYYQEGSDEIFQGNVNTTYSWSSYLDYYNYHFPEGSDSYVQDKYSPRQGNLVAALCRDCAYAIDMQYTISGSGAYTFDVPDGMINRFGYPATALHYYDRDFYSDEEWSNIIYAELAQGYPFIYAGYDPNGGGGHAFVADGCDAEGLLHVNWGWSGSSDGYYAFDLLNPDTDQFSEGQEIVTGIRSETLPGDEYGSLIGCYEPYTFSYNNELRMLSFSWGGIYNICGKTINGFVGIVLENIELPDSTKNFNFLDEEEELMPFWGWREDTDSIKAEFTSGKYRVYFGSKDYRDVNYQKARTPNGPLYYEMTVGDDGNVTINPTPVYGNGSTDPSMGISKVTVSERKSEKFVFDLQGRNLGTNPSVLPKGIYVIGGKKVVK